MDAPPARRAGLIDDTSSSFPHLPTHLPTHLSPSTALSYPGSQAAAIGETRLVRALLIGIALVFLTLFLFVPLAFVFFEGLKKGLGVYLAAQLVRIFETFHSAADAGGVRQA